MGDDWKTLRVPVEAWEEAKEQKEEHGRTWGEQIVRSGGEIRDVPVASGNERDTDLLEDVHEDVRKLQELTERVPQDTAEQLEGRFR